MGSVTVNDNGHFADCAAAVNALVTQVIVQLLADDGKTVCRGRFSVQHGFGDGANRPRRTQLTVDDVLQESFIRSFFAEQVDPSFQFVVREPSRFVKRLEFKCAAVVFRFDMQRNVELNVL